MMLSKVSGGHSRFIQPSLHYYGNEVGDINANSNQYGN